MKVVTIQIQVPDGATVNVQNGAGDSRTARRPFVRREAPPRPAGGCPRHGLPWELKEAGTRRDGTEYNAFWHCPEQGCRIYPKGDEEFEFESASYSNSEDNEMLPF